MSADGLEMAAVMMTMFPVIIMLGGCGRPSLVDSACECVCVVALFPQIKAGDDAKRYTQARRMYVRTSPSLLLLVFV